MSRKSSIRRPAGGWLLALGVASLLIGAACSSSGDSPSDSAHARADGLAPDAPLRRDGPRRDQLLDRAAVRDTAPDSYSYPVRARVLYNRHISRYNPDDKCVAFDGQTLTFVGRGRTSDSRLLYRFDVQGKQRLAAALPSLSTSTYTTYGCPFVAGTTSYALGYWASAKPTEQRYGILGRSGAFDPKKGDPRAPLPVHHLRSHEQTLPRLLAQSRFRSIGASCV